MKRRQLRKDEIRAIIEKADIFFDHRISKKDNVELIDDVVILVNGSPLLFMSSGEPLPLLKNIPSVSSAKMKTVTVDMGAIPFVTKGADVMRPGITGFDPAIRLGEPVLIIDETHNKPLAIGRSLVCGSDISSMQKGKVVAIIHHVGDTLWSR